MTYWIVVGSADNFDLAIKRGFDLFGFKSTRRRQTGEMAPGDKLVFYLTGVKQFGGIARVTSESFEDHKKIFTSYKKPNEDYPFRVKTKAEIVLDEHQRLSVPDYVPRLEFTKKGQTKSWALFFQGNLHKISERDYKLLEKDMKGAKKLKKPAAAKAAPAAAKKPAAKKTVAKKTAAKRAPARKKAAARR